MWVTTHFDPFRDKRMQFLKSFFVTVSASDKISHQMRNKTQKTGKFFCMFIRMFLLKIWFKYNPALYPKPFLEGTVCKYTSKGNKTILSVNKFSRGHLLHDNVLQNSVT
jgi:hypothetical protein